MSVSPDTVLTCCDSHLENLFARSVDDRFQPQKLCVGAWQLEFINTSTDQFFETSFYFSIRLVNDFVLSREWNSQFQLAAGSCHERKIRWSQIQKVDWGQNGIRIPRKVPARTTAVCVGA